MMQFDVTKVYSIIVFDNKFQLEDWQTSYPERQIVQIQTIPVNDVNHQLRFHFAVTYIKEEKNGY